MDSSFTTKCASKKDINFRFHALKKGEEAKIIGFDQCDNTARVTVN